MAVVKAVLSYADVVEKGCSCCYLIPLAQCLAGAAYRRGGRSRRQWNRYTFLPQAERGCKPFESDAGPKLLRELQSGDAGPLDQFGGYAYHVGFSRGLALRVG